METIQQLDRLETLLNEIPTEVRDMYQITIDSFMSESKKLYIRNPMWLTLYESQIEKVTIYTTVVEIKCTSIVLILAKDRMNVQVIVF